MPRQDREPAAPPEPLRGGWPLVQLTEEPLALQRSRSVFLKRLGETETWVALPCGSFCAREPCAVLTPSVVPGRRV